MTNESKENYRGNITMNDLDDFYIFQMLTSDNSSLSGSNNTPSVPGVKGCSTALIVLAVIGWVLWFIGKLS